MENGGVIIPFAMFALIGVVGRLVVKVVQDFARGQGIRTRQRGWTGVECGSERPRSRYSSGTRPGTA